MRETGAPRTINRDVTLVPTNQDIFDGIDFQGCLVEWIHRSRRGFRRMPGDGPMGRGRIRPRWSCRRAIRHSRGILSRRGRRGALCVRRGVQSWKSGHDPLWERLRAEPWWRRRRASWCCCGGGTDRRVYDLARRDRELWCRRRCSEWTRWHSSGSRPWRSGRDGGRPFLFQRLTWWRRGRPPRWRGSRRQSPHDRDRAVWRSNLLSRRTSRPTIVRLLEHAIALRSVEFPPMRRGAGFNLEALKSS